MCAERRRFVSSAPPTLADDGKDEAVSRVAYPFSTLVGLIVIRANPLWIRSPARVAVRRDGTAARRSRPGGRLSYFQQEATRLPSIQSRAAGSLRETRQSAARASPPCASSPAPDPGSAG